MTREKAMCLPGPPKHVLRCPSSPLCPFASRHNCVMSPKRREGSSMRRPTMPLSTDGHMHAGGHCLVMGD